MTEGHFIGLQGKGFPVAEVPEVVAYAYHIDAVDLLPVIGLVALGDGHATEGQCGDHLAGGVCAEAFGELLVYIVRAGADGMLGMAQPQRGEAIEGVVHRVAHQERTGEDSGGQGHAEEYAQMHPPVIAQATFD